jgi:hypothetical protein
MNPRVESDTYDRAIVPAETAARKEREGENYKQVLQTDEQDVQSDTDLDTTSGYTVDQEGLLNNYAVEPEMYYEVPGDARQQEEMEAAERTMELSEVNDTDETGKLTDKADQRGKGTGVI